MNPVKKAAFCAVALVCFVSCFKEKSFEIDTTNPNGGGGGGGAAVTYGFSFKDAAAAEHKGCIDTAYYETTSVKVLTIEGFDADNNFYSIFIAVTGNLTTGTYGIMQGAGMVMIDKNTNGYQSIDPAAPLSSDFKLKITAISATEITAEFSGTLKAPVTGDTFKVTNGSLKAKIGETTPC